MSEIADYISYHWLCMNTQRSPWKQPGVVAVMAVIAVINLVVDWLWFRPTNWPLFIAVEAIVLGSIIALARWRVLSGRDGP
jgi:hypothetical protein